MAGLSQAPAQFPPVPANPLRAASSRLRFLLPRVRHRLNRIRRFLLRVRRRLGRIRRFHRHGSRPGLRTWRFFRGTPGRRFFRGTLGRRVCGAARQRIWRCGGGQGPSEAQRICLNFPSIREDVEKSAALIKTASERKASREEVCPLFKTFAAKEGKMIAFLETNQKLCGVPPKIIVQVKTNHAGTIRIRNAVCSAGPMPGVARGPTLSDALGGPIIADDASAKLPGAARLTR